MQKSNLKIQNDKSKFKNEFSQRLINFSLNVIKLCSSIRQERNLWPLADQLIRSSTSIGANVTEAKSSSSKREYLNYFQIALKSANETVYWLTLVREACSKQSPKAKTLLNEAEEISRILASGIITMKEKIR